jgi:hypothetical protein
MEMAKSAVKIIVDVPCLCQNIAQSGGFAVLLWIPGNNYVVASSGTLGALS